jgi:CheY-like chemotaxis protein
MGDIWRQVWISAILGRRAPNSGCTARGIRATRRQQQGKPRYAFAGFSAIILAVASSTYTPGLGERAAASAHQAVECTSRKRIYIVDDHRFFVAGISSLINHTVGLEVCGCTCDGRRALGDVKRLQPDLVLLDVNLAHSSGLEIARSLRQTIGDIPILFLSSLAGAKVREEAAGLGALGFLEKTQEPSRLLDGIRRALRM